MSCIKNIQDGDEFVDGHKLEKLRRKLKNIFVKIGKLPLVRIIFFI